MNLQVDTIGVRIISNTTPLGSLFLLIQEHNPENPILIIKAPIFHIPIETRAKPELEACGTGDDYGSTAC